MLQDLGGFRRRVAAHENIKAARPLVEDQRLSAGNGACRFGFERP